uniref:Putative C1q domain containing protein MgC1q16 n=1 Tax=Mytilus galloprovincialis TaxID=29158 RepID=F0V453_MYTGA|nr:putative C1q domain containing protein MgC1q16 [Mytilus galloprovincialis]
METFFCIVLLLPGIMAAVDMQKEISEIRNILQQQESQIISLREENQAIRKDVSRLDMEKHSLKMEIRSLRKHVDRLDLENLALKKEVDSLGLIISRTGDDETKLTDDKIEHTNDVSRVGVMKDINGIRNRYPITRREQLKAKRLIGTGQVNTQTTAFYAYMSKDEPHPSAHHQLIFDEVKTNLGNGYSKFTGTFTVPTAGVYVFSYTLYTGNHGAINFDIHVNDAIYDSIYGETDDVSADYDSDSGTIVVALNQGDKVYLRSNKDCTGIVLGGRYAKSTFAGWKLN